MCGIVGYVGVREAAPILLSGLKRLEYRGYDSAGVAVHGEAAQRIAVAKAAGPLKNLAQRTDDGHALHGTCGVGHTRWATHGKPDEKNAHPHASPDHRVALVHNGIIENHCELRQALEREGYAFQSDTDTEAAALLLDSCYAKYSGETPRLRALHAIRDMMQRLRGSYALGILFGDQPGALYAARKDSPLVIGVCEGEGHVLASDVPAVLGLTRRVIGMENMEMACLTREAAHLYNLSCEQFERKAEAIAWQAEDADRGGYAHFMLKEIMEQPRAVQKTLEAYIRGDAGGWEVDLGETGPDGERLGRIEQAVFVGCGSAFHAGQVGAAAAGQLARMPAWAELASELRYREAGFGRETLAVIISQSGETADSLAALRQLRARGVYTLAIVNVMGSSIAREADAVLRTHAGPEISVATTKAYAAQLAALYLLAMQLAKARGTIDPPRMQAFLADMLALPDSIDRALQTRETVRRLAKRFIFARDAFFIGRGLDHAVCMEGSLKLKEVSYIHAEAYAAGELKHGTISLIEGGMPVVGVMTQAQLLGKTAANMAEAGARGAYLLAIAPEGVNVAGTAHDALLVPRTDALLMPSVAIVPLQLLAYEVGCARGLDVDKPRNLAKSVTVE